MKMGALIAGCETCPHKIYYSGGRSECTKVQTILPPFSELRGGPAEWCPLPDYPAQAFETMRAELAQARAALAQGKDQP